MEKENPSVSKFDPSKSLERAAEKKLQKAGWTIRVGERELFWTNRMERVSLIRSGLPYDSIEVISKRTDLPVKQMLAILGVPQTTYNKKKRDKELLSGRDTEVVLLLVELLDFGIEVFNNEADKFRRWLKKPNVSLGGLIPESLFDSVTGIQEVKNALNRLEFGNMA
jgi:putative toxin-antitoxin system antitoxin component (TIGR02293 family)